MKTFVSQETDKHLEFSDQWEVRYWQPKADTQNLPPAERFNACVTSTG